MKNRTRKFERNDRREKKYTLIPEGYENEYKRYLQEESREKCEKDMKDLQRKSEKFKEMLKSSNYKKEERKETDKINSKMEESIIKYCLQKGMKSTNGCKIIKEKGKNFIVKYINSDGKEITEEISEQFFNNMKNFDDNER